MKRLDRASLASVTGGGGGPDPVHRLEKIRLVDATSQDIAEAAIHLGIQVPDGKMIRKVKAKMERDRRWGLPEREKFRRNMNGGEFGFRDLDR